MADGYDLAAFKSWLARQRESFESASPDWLAIDMPDDPWEAFRLGARLANDDAAVMVERAASDGVCLGANRRVCPECGSLYGVRKDGTLLNHNRSEGRLRRRCPGSDSGPPTWPAALERSG